MPTTQQNGRHLDMADETRWSFGAMSQRVTGLEQGLHGVNAQLNALAQRLESSFSTLSSKIEERSRPQWSLLVSIGGLMITFFAAVGWLAYAPIRENQTDLKMVAAETAKAITSLPERFVTIREVDARQARTLGDFNRFNADLNRFNTELVPRAEHAERWRSVDQQFSNLQRQLDDQKKAFGDTFSLRDALQQMQRRIDNLEGKKS